VAHACQSSVIGCQSSVIGCQSSVIARQSSVSHKRTSMKRAQVNRGRRLTAVHILSNSNQQTWLELHLLTFPSSCRCNSSQFPSHFPLKCASSFAIRTNKPGWRCIFSPFRQVVGATPASFQATSHCNAHHPQQIKTNKPGWSCIFSPFSQVVGATPASFQVTSHCACAQSQPSHKHAHTTNTHVDSTSTNMKFSFVSFLAAVFSSPPSTPLFGESSSVTVRILCFSL
jgi:hypothetical protein